MILKTHCACWVFMLRQAKGSKHAPMQVAARLQKASPIARMWKKRTRRFTISMKRHSVAQEHIMIREISHCGRP